MEVYLTVTTEPSEAELLIDYPIPFYPEYSGYKVASITDGKIYFSSNLAHFKLILGTLL